MFRADMNVVNVIEEIRFKSKASTAAIADEFLYLLGGLITNPMSLFVILQCDLRR